MLDALRLGRPLTPKERVTHTNGLVSVLAELHDRIDTLVLQAYGWADLAPALVGQPGGTLPWPEKPAAQAAAEEELLQRLVALNTERAAEEARGEVRWLRPEFQDPARRAAALAAGAATLASGTAALASGEAAPPGQSPEPPAAPVATQDELDLEDAGAGAADAADDATSAALTPAKGAKPTAGTRRPWPNTLPEQMRAIADLLTAAGRPVALATLEAEFTGRGPWKRRIPQILEALAALGRAREVDGLWVAG